MSYQTLSSKEAHRYTLWVILGSRTQVFDVSRLGIWVAISCLGINGLLGYMILKYNVVICDT